MAAVWELVGVLALVLGVLVAVVLVAPLSATIEGDVDAEAFEGSYVVRIRWALGLIGLELRSGQAGAVTVLGVRVARLRPRADAQRRTPKDRPRKHTSDGKAAPGLGVWAVAHRDALWRAFVRALGPLHLRANIQGAVGLPEPDDTVWLALALQQLAVRLPAGTIDVDVDYSDAVLDLAGRASAWVIPLHMLGVATALYLFTDLGRAIRRARPLR